MCPPGGEPLWRAKFSELKPIPNYHQKFQKTLAKIWRRCWKDNVNERSASLGSFSGTAVSLFQPCAITLVSPYAKSSMACLFLSNSNSSSGTHQLRIPLYMRPIQRLPTVSSGQESMYSLPKNSSGALQP